MTLVRRCSLNVCTHALEDNHIVSVQGPLRSEISIRSVSKADLAALVAVS